MFATDGLKIYELPDTQTKQVGVIPFGTKIIMDENSATKKEYKIKELESFNEGEKGFYISGYWLKINYNDVDGYILDGYLLSIPPFQKEKEPDLDTSLQEFIPIEDRYFRKIFSPKGKIKNVKTWAGFGAPQFIEEYEQVYENGASFHYNDGGNFFVIKIPHYTLRAGYLIVKSFMRYINELNYNGYKKEWCDNALDFKSWTKKYLDDNLGYLKEGKYEEISNDEAFHINVINDTLKITMTPIYMQYKYGGEYEEDNDE